MERERKVVAVYSKVAPKIFESDPTPLKALAANPQHLRSIARWADLRYIDTLTKKQQKALLMIDMLDAVYYVEGVGYWVNSFYDGVPAKRYVLDC